MLNRGGLGHDRLPAPRQRDAYRERMEEVRRKAALGQHVGPTNKRKLQAKSYQYHAEERDAALRQQGVDPEQVGYPETLEDLDMAQFEEIDDDSVDLSRSANEI